MLLFLINPQNIILKNNHLSGTYPIKIVLMGGILGFVIINIISKMIVNRISQKSMICEIEIFYKGNSKKIKTMIDTGNLLKEPYTDRPVIIVEKEALNELICEKCGENFEMIIRGEAEIPLGMFLIPYRSIGNSSGFLLYVQDVETKKLYNDLVIGICSENISDNNNYSGIFGLETLDERVCSL